MFSYLETLHHAIIITTGSNLFSCHFIPKRDKKHWDVSGNEPGWASTTCQRSIHYTMTSRTRMSGSKIKCHEIFLRWPLFTKPLIPSKVAWSVNGSILSARAKRGSLPARWRRLLFPNRRSRTWSTRQSRRWRKRSRELKMVKRLSSISHKQNVSGTQLSWVQIPII